MNYNEIWEAVDKLAKINGLSPSGLAKKAGLDSTTFNKSKRIRPDGKKRWPSLDSINKITSVCGISFEDFYHILDETGDTDSIHGQPTIPFFELSNISSADTADKKGSFINFPEFDPSLYAVEIDTKIVEPYYKGGSIVIVSETSEIRRGDKIIIVLKNNPVAFVGEFINRTGLGLKFYNLTDNRSQISVNNDDIVKIGRILWVSQ